MPLAEIVKVTEEFGGRPAAAIVDGQVLDAGRRFLNGETISLIFSDRARAVQVARALGTSPSFSEVEDTAYEQIRQRAVELLEDLLGKPDELKQWECPIAG